MALSVLREAFENAVISHMMVRRYVYFIFCQKPACLAIVVVLCVLCLSVRCALWGAAERWAGLLAGCLHHVEEQPQVDFRTVRESTISCHDTEEVRTWTGVLATVALIQHWPERQSEPQKCPSAFESTAAVARPRPESCKGGVTLHSFAYSVK